MVTGEERNVLPESNSYHFLIVEHARAHAHAHTRARAHTHTHIRPAVGWYQSLHRVVQLHFTNGALEMDSWRHNEYSWRI